MDLAFTRLEKLSVRMTARWCRPRMSSRLDKLDDQIFAQGMGDAFDGGEPHVFGMVFQPRDGGFPGLGALREGFLRDARSLARLPKQHAHLEFLVAAFKMFRELFVGALATADVFVEIVFHRLVFRLR